MIYTLFNAHSFFRFGSLNQVFNRLNNHQDFILICVIVNLSVVAHILYYNYTHVDFNFMFMIFFSEVVIYVLFNIKYNLFNSLICEVKN